MKIYLTVILFFFCYNSTFASEQVEYLKFLCVDEDAGGIEFNKDLKIWQSTTFNADRKYIIRYPITKAAKNAKVTIKSIGSDYTNFTCPPAGPSIYCNGLEGRFIFNLKTLRFMRAHLLGGYVKGDDDTGTPHVAIGTCEVL